MPCRYTIDWRERDWQRSTLEVPSVFPRGFNRGLLLTWKSKWIIHENCFSVCKKSTSSSAAKHQLHLIFVAIWGTAHYLVKQPYNCSYIIGTCTIGTALCVPLATSWWHFFVFEWYSPPGGICLSVWGGPWEACIETKEVSRVIAGVLEAKHRWLQSHYVDFNVETSREPLPLPIPLSSIYEYTKYNVWWIHVSTVWPLPLLLFHTTCIYYTDVWR